MRNAIRNRRLVRIGRVGPSLWKLPSEEAERRVPSAPNGPALQCECGYRIYNEHGGRAMPGHSVTFRSGGKHASAAARRPVRPGLGSWRLRGCAKLTEPAGVRQASATEATWWRGGMWRSLVSVSVWGTEGPGFKSRHPDWNSNTRLNVGTR
jgi:hypothetical protein